MNQRRLPWSLLALSAICFAALPLLAKADTERHSHRPPWDSTVVWSQTLHIGGSTIQMDIAPGQLSVSHQQIALWVETAARAVSQYYGRFPVPRVRVLVVPIADSGGIGGSTWGDVDEYPAFIRMRVGARITSRELNDDWTMTHEFVHTALPSLSSDHHWLEEGLATYVEPIAREQIGALTPEYVWKETVEGMPQGEPRPGEQGLDNTHTWANTYWSGALFCMMADIQIRKATHNKEGLQDALRGILVSGGSIAVDWPIAKVIAVGDQATGTSVLADLYEKMGKQPFPPIDLEDLWKQLGIRLSGGNVEFNNQAPLAAIREAILRPAAASGRQD